LVLRQRQKEKDLRAATSALGAKVFADKSRRIFGPDYGRNESAIIVHPYPEVTRMK